MEGVAEVSKYDDLEIGDHIKTPDEYFTPGEVIHIHNGDPPAGNGDNLYICLRRDDGTEGGGCIIDGNATWVVTRGELERHLFEIDIPVKSIRLEKIIKKFKEDWNESQDI